MFIDEIDKIVTSSDHRYGGDASAEGVQRDLLPIIEGAGRTADPPPSPQALPALGLVIRILCSMHLPCLNLFLPHSPGAGSTVSTKHGNVNTDYILFICSGAFHSCKPSDMLAELQGRLPIRVELKGLT